jgi:hypothetical protein
MLHRTKDVDARHKAGHDSKAMFPPSRIVRLSEENVTARAIDVPESSPIGLKIGHVKPKNSRPERPP